MTNKQSNTICHVLDLVSRGYPELFAGILVYLRSSNKLEIYESDMEAALDEIESLIGPWQGNRPPGTKMSDEDFKVLIKKLVNYIILD